MSAIKDGTGKGYLAKVDEDHHLHTRSLGIPIHTSKAINARLYVVSSGLLAVTATQGLMGWILYNETEKHLAVEDIFISWNGGDTTHNLACEVELKLDDSQPDTNTASNAVDNTHSGSSIQLNVTALKWDGVGTGMTGHAGGVSLVQGIFSQGRTPWLLRGGAILGPQEKLSIYARGEEVGKFAFDLWMYELEISELEV